MKKLSILALGCLLAVGCSTPETVVVSPNGEKASVSQDGAKVTVTDAKGNASATVGGTVTEDDLRLPFYPGSVEKANASMKVEDSTSKNIMAGRTTKDDPDKVIAFYKDKIENPQPATSSNSDSKLASVTGKLKDGSEVSVIATKQGSGDTEMVVSVKIKK